MAENESDVYRYFITMKSPGDMSIQNWQEHVDALNAAVGKFVPEDLWGFLDRFGPESAGFGFPAVCFEIPLTMMRLAEMAEFIINTFPWFRIPLNMYRTELFDPTEKA